MQSKTNATALAGALKEQFALILFVILFAGLISTETYYEGFGLRYQFIELSIPHLVTRGLTAVFDSPLLLLAYGIAIVWLSAGAALFVRSRPHMVGFVQIISYAVILVIVVVAYFSAVAAGRHAANLDLAASTSRLPTVQAMTSTAGAPLPFAGYRLLIAGPQTVAVFRPTASPAESPFIHLLKRETVGDITISR